MSWLSTPARDNGVQVLGSKVLDLQIPTQRDNFTTESPTRAFTEFRECGLYAMGRGFRPAVDHIPVYLDAMESKAGWALVQIIHAPSAPLTMIFRKVAE